MILIACPACARQYDVTGVPVGNRVRCACDAILHVGTGGSLAVRALHCSHCGDELQPRELKVRPGPGANEAQRAEPLLPAPR